MTDNDNRPKKLWDYTEESIDDHHEQEAERDKPRYWPYVLGGIVAIIFVEVVVWLF